MGYVLKRDFKKYRKINNIYIVTKDDYNWQVLNGSRDKILEEAGFFHSITKLTRDGKIIYTSTMVIDTENQIIYKTPAGANIYEVKEDCYVYQVKGLTYTVRYNNPTVAVDGRKRYDYNKVSAFSTADGRRYVLRLTETLELLLDGKEFDSVGNGYRDETDGKNVIKLTNNANTFSIYDCDNLKLYLSDYKAKELYIQTANDKSLYLIKKEANNKYGLIDFSGAQLVESIYEEYDVKNGVFIFKSYTEFDSSNLKLRTLNNIFEEEEENEVE